jgi:hypothetical protein
MPQKLYTATDMSSGPTIVNAPDPSNLQDVATKNYVDDYHLRFGRYETLWEREYTQQCSVANFTNGYTHITTGPSDITITKLYPETAILIVGQMSYYINVSSAQTKLVCGINGISGLEICGLWGGATGEHTSFPMGIRWYWGNNTYFNGATGSMVVAFYMYVSNANTTVSTDSNDLSNWTISEVRSGP